MQLLIQPTNRKMDLTQTHTIEVFEGGGYRYARLKAVDGLPRWIRLFAETDLKQDQPLMWGDAAEMAEYIDLEFDYQKLKGNIKSAN
jgi:hypothetical protein